MVMIKGGYVTLQGRTGGNKFLVKSYSGFSAIVVLNNLCVPTKYVGKRIRIKAEIELVDDDLCLQCHQVLDEINDNYVLCKPCDIVYKRNGGQIIAQGDFQHVTA